MVGHNVIVIELGRGFPATGLAERSQEMPRQCRWRVCLGGSATLQQADTWSLSDSLLVIEVTRYSLRPRWRPRLGRNFKFMQFEAVLNTIVLTSS
jgi:hypothetical protein